MINRSALIVRPKKPYLDWAAGLDDSGVSADIKGDETVYLIPEIDDEEQRLRKDVSVKLVKGEESLRGSC
jgi:hypothetical protein